MLIKFSSPFYAISLLFLLTTVFAIALFFPVGPAYEPITFTGQTIADVPTLYQSAPLFVQEQVSRQEGKLKILGLANQALGSWDLRITDIKTRPIGDGRVEVIASVVIVNPESPGSAASLWANLISSVNPDTRP